MNEASVVVDTNVFFSFLLRRETESRRVFLTDSAHTFFCPRFFFVELFKHKERVAVASQLVDQELWDCMHELLARVQFIDESCIPVGIWMEARRLCRDVDLKDAPFVALTLHLDGRLWSDDEELKTALRGKGFGAFFTPRRQP